MITPKDFKLIIFYNQGMNSVKSRARKKGEIRQPFILLFSKREV